MDSQSIIIRSGGEILVTTATHSMKIMTLESDSKDRFILLYLVLFLAQVLCLMLTANLADIKIAYLFNTLNSAIMTFLFVFYFKKLNYLFVNLVLFTILQNLIIGLGTAMLGTHTSGATVKFLLVYKEVLIILFVTFALLKFAKEINLLKFEKITLLLIPAVILYSFVVSNAGLDAKTYYLRTFLTFFISYSAGRLLFFGLKNKTRELQYILTFIVYSGIIVAIFGFVFMFIGQHSHVWRDWFNLGLINQAKTGRFTEFPDWRTQLGDYILPRMFSIFFDAISLSYFFTTALICSMLRTKKNLLLDLILFLSLVSTVGKGAIMILLIVVVWSLLIIKKVVKVKKLTTILIASFFISFILISQFSFKSSIDVHFAGLLQPLQSSPHNPLGKGIGIGGNYHAMNSEGPAWEFSETGAESFIGVLVYQLGYPGMIAFFIFFIGIIATLASNIRDENPNNKLLIIMSGTMFSIIVASMFQEGAMGINFTGILVILIGYTVSLARSEEPGLSSI